MTTFLITCSFPGGSTDVEISASCCSESDVLDFLKDYADIEGLETEFDSFDVDDWNDVPEFAQDFGVLEELLPALDASHYELEIFEAAHDLGIDFSDVDEAYQGEFDSDEDFAQNVAEELGAIDKNASWPQYCIDWEYAAKELMYDYAESGGHYFRNL